MSTHSSEEKEKDGSLGVEVDVETVSYSADPVIPEGGLQAWLAVFGVRKLHTRATALLTRENT